MEVSSLETARVFSRSMLFPSSIAAPSSKKSSFTSNFYVSSQRISSTSISSKDAMRSIPSIIYATSAYAPSTDA